MIGEVPGVVVALVIGVILAALAVCIAKGTKSTGEHTLEGLDAAAQEALGG